MAGHGVHNLAVPLGRFKDARDDGLVGHIKRGVALVLVTVMVARLVVGLAAVVVQPTCPDGGSR